MEGQRPQPLPQPLTATSAAEEKRKLTPYEIDQKLNKIDDLLEFLRGNILANRIEQIRSSNPHHPDIIAVLPSLNDMGEFSNAVSMFARTIETMAKYSVTEADFHVLLESRDLELRSHIIKFARWRNDAMTRLIEMCKAVSV